MKEPKKRPGILDKRTEEQMKPMKAPEVTKMLDLHSLKGIPWFVQEASASRAEGISEALEWLTQNTG